MCTIYVQFTGNIDSKLKSINVMQILDELQGQMDTSDTKLLREGITIKVVIFHDFCH